MRIKTITTLNTFIALNFVIYSSLRQLTPNLSRNAAPEGGVYGMDYSLNVNLFPCFMREVEFYHKKTNSPQRNFWAHKNLSWPAFPILRQEPLQDFLCRCIIKTANGEHFADGRKFPCMPMLECIRSPCIGKCPKCGCTSLKLKFDTESCPTGKW